jgi:hypothetical protein
MERDDWEDAGDYVEVSVPTELVKRVVSAISITMMDWEKEQRDKGEEFNALIGMSAVKLALDFIGESMENIHGETMQ